MSYFLYHHNTQEHYEFEDPVTIGRDSNKNGIVLENELISSIHFAIISRDSKWYIQDQNSTCGTLLNKRKVPPAFFVALEQEDVIECGEQIIIYSADEQLDEKKVKEIIKKYENVFPGGYEENIIKNVTPLNNELIETEGRVRDLTKLITEQGKQISTLEQELAQATAAYRQKIIEIEKEFKNKINPLKQQHQNCQDEKEEKIILAKDLLKRVNTMIKQAEGKEYALELDFDSTETKRKIRK